MSHVEVVKTGQSGMTGPYCSRTMTSYVHPARCCHCDMGVFGCDCIERAKPNGGLTNPFRWRPNIWESSFNPHNIIDSRCLMCLIDRRWSNLYSHRAQSSTSLASVPWRFFFGISSRLYWPSLVGHGHCSQDAFDVVQIVRSRRPLVSFLRFA